MSNITKSDQEWKALLTADQYRVCRKKGTEPSHSGEYNKTTEPGVYRCVCCGNELFSSSAKFDSGTGWPSYWEPIRKEAIGTKEDSSLFMHRTEVVCNQCDAHLGHVFTDGPRPTGLRYCINSVALKLEKKR